MAAGAKADQLLAVQLLGAGHPLAGELLKLMQWHPHLRVARLIEEKRKGDSAEELHPALFGWRHLAAESWGVQAEKIEAADIHMVLPSYAGEMPLGGQCLDFRTLAGEMLAGETGCGGAPMLPELRTPPANANLCALPTPVLAAALALEPLLDGGVVSPRESIDLSLSAGELEALRPLLTGHFRLESLPHESKWEGVRLTVPLFEGYSEHDALAAYRTAYSGSPWVRLRRPQQAARGVQGSPACELRVSVLERTDATNPIPLMQVVASLDEWPATAARAIAALNLSRGWGALEGLVP